MTTDAALLRTTPELPQLAAHDVVYNVAIGSNMDGAKLRSRKVGSRPLITPLSPGVPCRVPNWVLSFEFLAMPPSEPVMAAAVRKEGATLHGVLWKLTRHDYDTLARSEGCTSARSLYVEVEVEAHPYNAPPVRALVFAMRDPPLVFPPHLHPSERYMRMLVAGARAAKLDPAVVHALEKAPTARKAHPTVKVWTTLTAVGMFWFYKRGQRLMDLSRKYTPFIAKAYSKREGAIVGGKPWRGRVWTAVMLLVMLPYAFLGCIIKLFRLRGHRFFRRSQ